MQLVGGFVSWGVMLKSDVAATSARVATTKGAAFRSRGEARGHLRRMTKGQRAARQVVRLEVFVSVGR